MNWSKAEALEAAHEQGIIHRDLKPANIKVKDDGTVKVLDFGLAKAMDRTPQGDPSESPTLTASATAMGVIMGTAAYMSPEQARGRPVDKRSDIWAFGAVLYEMLSGRRPFEGRDVSETLGAVLRLDPDWDMLPDETPPRLSTLLRRCLEKESQERVRDIGDVRLAMTGGFETTVNSPSDSVVATPLQVWQRPISVVFLTTVSVVAIGLAVWALLSTPRSEPPELMRFTIAPPDIAPLGFEGTRSNLVISSDGTYVVYASMAAGDSVPQLTLRSFDQLVGVPIQGGLGGHAPFLSPNGEWVGFIPLSSHSTLQRVARSGGTPEKVTESPSDIWGVSWGEDDQIIFGASTGLYRVPAGGGEPVELSTPDRERGESFHLWPTIIPGRQAVVFAISTSNVLVSGELAVLELDTLAVRKLGVPGTRPRYLSTGHLVFAASDGSVRAIPFDVTSLRVTGNAVSVVDSAHTYYSGAAYFSVSDTGHLVYIPGGPEADQRSLVWVDRNGGYLRPSGLCDRAGLARRRIPCSGHS